MKDYQKGNMSAKDRLGYKEVHTAAEKLCDLAEHTMSIVTAGPSHNVGDRALPVGICIDNQCYWIKTDPTDEDVRAFIYSPEKECHSSGSFCEGDEILEKNQFDSDTEPEELNIHGVI